VFPAVVVDLGSQVPATEAAWVLAACNAAIANGTCELEAPAATPARAVAIVRLQGRGQRVRIEVGLRESERAAWSVREIEFATADPARERWRTVGLVLATLVGEVEAARAEQSASGAVGGTPPSTGETAPATSEAAPVPSAPAASEPAAPEAAATEPAPAQTPEQQAEPEPEPEPEPLEPAPAVRVPARERDEEPQGPPAFPRHQGVFVGLGVLASPAASGGSLPWGAAARGGYSLPSGWVLALNADYSRATFEQGYALDTLRLTPGIGYRLVPAAHWSIQLGAYAGVRALWASSERPGAVQQNAWSPLIAGSFELWWQALPVGGLWSALEVGTIGRATRVQGRDAALEGVVPAADARAFLGLWVAL
jgi:hypothetical protein